MKRLTTFPLPQPIRQEAEAFYGCRFDDCKVHISSAPAEMGAKAFTNGQDIWLDPEIADWSLAAAKPIYGHELAHIVQQRLGRVASTHSKCGIAVNDDAILEEEADQLGHLFALGKTGWLQGCDEKPRASPVIQCLVSIAGNSLEDFQALPQSVRQVVDLIQGGQDWLGWAIGEVQTKFEFPDVLSLVDEIQAGIHGNGLMLLPALDLLVNPLALLAMPDVGIEAIEAFVNTDSNNSVVGLEVEQALANQGFVQQAQLSVIPAFLEQVGLQSKPVFQALNLNDSIGIYRALSHVPGAWALQAKIQQEAATYAADYAVSPQAFADFYIYYLNLFKDSEFSTLNSQERQASARKRSDLMAEALRNSLRSPTLVGIPSPEQLKVSMDTWFSRGNSLGFSQISRGISALSGAANVLSAEDTQLPNQIQRYLRGAQKIVQTQLADQPQVAQDGSALFYTFGHTSPMAVLRLERGTGSVTLETMNANVNDALKDEDPVTVHS